MYLSFDKETLDGSPVVARRDVTILKEIIEELHQLQARDGLTGQHAVTSVRGSLVPEGYTPYPSNPVPVKVWPINEDHLWQPAATNTDL